MTRGAMFGAVALAVAGCGAEDRDPAPRPPALQRVDVGAGARGAAVFRPAGAARPLPVVVFVHGLFATDPDTYGAWIRHLVRDGNVVIYPAYQGALTPPAAFLANRPAVASSPASRAMRSMASASAHR